MKKIILLTIVLLCYVCTGCEEDNSTAIRQTVIDLPPGYELVSANYDSYHNYIGCFIRRADTSYVAEDKELLLYSARTATILRKYVFVEKYDYNFGDKTENKANSVTNLLKDGDTVIYIDNGFIVKKNVAIDVLTE